MVGGQVFEFEWHADREEVSLYCADRFSIPLFERERETWRFHSSLNVFNTDSFLIPLFERERGRRFHSSLSGVRIGFQYLFSNERPDPPSSVSLPLSFARVRASRACLRCACKPSIHRITPRNASEPHYLHIHQSQSFSSSCPLLHNPKA
jgi:hypothetical protein